MTPRAKRSAASFAATRAGLRDSVWPTRPTPLKFALPLLVALADVVQQHVVLERVGDEPFGFGVVSAVLYAVLLLRQLDKLFHRYRLA